MPPSVRSERISMFPPQPNSTFPADQPAIPRDSSRAAASAKVMIRFRFR